MSLRISIADEGILSITVHFCDLSITMSYQEKKCLHKQGMSAFLEGLFGETGPKFILRFEEVILCHTLA